MKMIDWNVLMSLRDDIGEEDFADVALVFVTEMEEKLADLGRDPARAGEEDFHFLRGSAANLGFSAMVSACEAAEEACNAGHRPNLEAVERAFRGALVEARPCLPDTDAA